MEEETETDRKRQRRKKMKRVKLKNSTQVRFATLFARFRTPPSLSIAKPLI